MNIHAHIRSAALAVFFLAPVLLPAAAAQEGACQYVEVQRLPLRYAGLGLNITTDGSINGTPASMLIDTGAFQTLLTPAATEPRKLALRNSGRSVAGIGGMARVYHARVDEFSIGPVKSGRMTLRVVKEFGHPPSFDALVGAPFLLQSDLEISLATKELKFFRPKNCDQAFLGYWDEKAVVVPFDPHMRDDANPHFTVVVNGVKLDAIIDSGASTSFITLNAAKRAGLKLDDPGVTRTADATGIGSRPAARWRTRFDRFEIGDELVRNAEVGVIDYEGAAEVLLGADFLRAHRVLFAMSQRKLYLSYVGGQPFGQRHRLEPWIEAEADAGNADAQMALATYYMAGKLVPRDPALAAQWLEKAALGGNPEANVMTGRRLLLAGKPAEAATRLRAGLDKLYGHELGPLWLYIARVRSGQSELAKTELLAARERNREDDWPAPIHDFYLGKLDEAKLLAEAQDERKLAKYRSCQALAAMAEWQAASGQAGEAARLSEQGKAQCATPPAQPAGSAAGQPATAALQ
ncbi:aspartyl protease family protein [Massilia sp. GCM10023247]|uniref:aspartyl protease family protein n=1 Tax=Massilia sp. GCM10023247 TaxID=3252643 RepID=UPI003621B235